MAPAEPRAGKPWSVWAPGGNESRLVGTGLSACSRRDLPRGANESRLMEHRLANVLEVEILLEQLGTAAKTGISSRPAGGVHKPSLQVSRRLRLRPSTDRRPSSLGASPAGAPCAFRRLRSRPRRVPGRPNPSVSCLATDAAVSLTAASPRSTTAQPGGGTTQSHSTVLPQPRG